MRRFVTGMVLAMALAGLNATDAAPRPPGGGGEVKIAWWGQSMFEIVTSKGTRIITDPQYLEAYKPREMTADVVLMSHFHNDHTRTDCIKNIKDAKQFNALKKDGTSTDWNDVDEKVGKAKEIRIQSLGTYHDAMGGTQRGKNGVWIIDVDGLRIVHLGDLGHTLTTRQLKKLGKVDILMIPVGGVYTLNGIDAQKVVKQINPTRAVIPMHYGTVVYDDLLPLKYFLDEQDEDTPRMKRKPRTWYTVDSASKRPEKVPVVILDYQGSPEGGKKPKDKGKEKAKDK
jgi:L-ascorbate metabolism protein UlaG (beta-lactamase superfamily)